MASKVYFSRTITPDKVLGCIISWECPCPAMWL